MSIRKWRRTVTFKIKWFYLNCGAAAEGAIFLSCMHKLIPTIFCIVSAIWCWYIAENEVNKNV